MGTEQISPRFTGIDAWPPGDILDSFIEGQFVAVAAVRAARGAIEAAARGVEERLMAGGRLAYAGAGTSGRLAVQDGVELIPTFSWPEERVIYLIAGGEPALTRAVEGAEDRAEEGARLVGEAGLQPADVLIAIAASGTTPFTLGALRAAKARGALAVGIANNAGTPLLGEADHAIHLDTGSEAIAGSTRMKAGTAQKIALNLLSSLVMMRLGRVYQGLMVDVQATNEKLVRRSQGMLMQLTGCGPEEAETALSQAGGSVKLAIMLRRGFGLEQARAALAAADGHLRAALALLNEKVELERGERRRRAG
jgi:N-acetylmuramic acid 6-phosphate etherase